MVQFVFTPWRNRAELLRVRSQLYPRFATGTTTNSSKPTSPPSPWWSSPEELRDIENAIARVFMWVHRGGCPHVVESTALLMSAIVFDERGGHDAVAGAGVTAGYLVGFTRFVTGLLDSHQDKARKLSMYGVAKTIGLPASFVELRHQGTHEPMPSLGQLRPAARRALVWIWEYYWENLPGEAVAGGSDDRLRGPVTDEATDKRNEEAEAQRRARSAALEERMCRGALVGFLQRQAGDVGEGAAREGLMRQLKKWDEGLVLRMLAEVGCSARDKGMLLRAVRLSRVLRGLDTADETIEGDGAGGEELIEELRRAGEASGKRKKGADDDGRGEGGKRAGWFVWEEPWTPRPIGVL